MKSHPTSETWLTIAEQLGEAATLARHHSSRARLAHMLTEARREALAQAGELALDEFRKARP